MAITLDTTGRFSSIAKMNKFRKNRIVGKFGLVTVVRGSLQYARFADAGGAADGSCWAGGEHST
jgi:hypothetical protein